MTSRTAAPSCTSTLTSASREPTWGLSRARARSGFKSATVTCSTVLCWSRSYAQADPCKPAPSTSIRIERHLRAQLHSMQDSAQRDGLDWPAPAPRSRGEARRAALDCRPMTQADLTRQRLVRAALELFTAEGYD